MKFYCIKYICSTGKIEEFEGDKHGKYHVFGHELDPPFRNFYERLDAGCFTDLQSAKEAAHNKITKRIQSLSEQIEKLKKIMEQLQ